MGNECGEALLNKDKAQEFLDALDEKKGPDYKKATKDLAKWKKSASASQKKFFKDQIDYLFENQAALERFEAAFRNGINTLANTTQEARQESAEQPSSPLRQPTPAQEAQAAAERGEAAPIPPEPHVTEEQMRQLEQQNQEADNTPLPDDDNDYLD